MEELNTYRIRFNENFRNDDYITCTSFTDNPDKRLYYFIKCNSDNTMRETIAVYKQTEVLSVIHLDYILDKSEIEDLLNENESKVKCRCTLSSISCEAVDKSILDSNVIAPLNQTGKETNSPAFICVEPAVYPHNSVVASYTPIIEDVYVNYNMVDLKVIQETNVDTNYIELMTVIKVHLAKYPKCLISVNSIGIGGVVVHRLKETEYSNRIIDFDPRIKYITNLITEDIQISEFNVTRLASNISHRKLIKAVKLLFYSSD